jgi:hypothetical protein
MSVGEPDGTERELTASSDVSSSSLQHLFLGLNIILEQWFRDGSSHLLTRAAFIVLAAYLPPSPATSHLPVGLRLGRTHAPPLLPCCASSQRHCR